MAEDQPTEGIEWDMQDYGEFCAQESFCETVALLADLKQGANYPYFQLTHIESVPQMSHQALCGALWWSQEPLPVSAQEDIGRLVGKPFTGSTYAEGARAVLWTVVRIEWDIVERMALLRTDAVPKFTG